ncbi:hypothetical protein ALC60_02145 [Trachymyrmex zeteki]|uniref:Ubiquitin-like protease family profile domain-containing protein n=1 Tax=Mycetomoellerius zeteki TaxID=64791 RepID=A0A151XEP7_9HYME|nr:hypothetical protein ALC60_02145 [Trachymyrmex zeteki]
MFGAWTKDVWLIPINYCSHWTLLMVLPKKKIMIYFDSLLGNPNNDGNINAGGKCGVHICSWAYVIATGRMEHFQEKDMNNARKGIATYLAEA